MTALVCVLSVCVVVLCAVVISQIKQLIRLNTWLKSPKDPLQADGLAGVFSNWQGVFDELYRQELSRQKRADRLNHAVHRLNRMMTAIPSAVLIVNKKGMIEWKNARSDDYLSLKNNKLTLKEQVANDEFSAFLDNIEKNSAEQDNGRQMDSKIQLGQKTLLCTLIPIEANANMLIVHDVSATEQLNISKNAFIANVSHELRTPLTVIQGFLETLADNELDRTLQQEFIGLMQKESVRMLDLIEGLLTLSRLENDDNPAKYSEPIDLSMMIAGIAKDASNLSDTHVITTDITPDIWVVGAYKELYSAFSNLIFNAVRHTDAGTDVVVSLSVVGDEICFFVKDNGDGISGEHLTNLITHHLLLS